MGKTQKQFAPLSKWEKPKICFAPLSKWEKPKNKFAPFSKWAMLLHNLYLPKVQGK
jgi:hypothetical protein